VKINFTNHALLKIELLKQYGFNVEAPMIKKVIINLIRRQKYEKIRYSKDVDALLSEIYDKDIRYG
jgi:hypothetical protein